MCQRSVKLTWLVVLFTTACTHPPMVEPLNGALELRVRCQRAVVGGGFEAHEEVRFFPPNRTALVVCDMWDRHWCRGAEARVAELAPRLNEVVARARARGVLVIHAPSTCTAFYAGTAARARAVSGARSPCTTIVPDLNTWNFGFPPASFSFESNTTTRGSAPRTSRTVRWGSSLRTVPAPTAMASWVARSRWPSRRDALPVIHRLCPFAQAIMPSRLTAAFNVTHGRPRVEAKWTSR